MSSSVSGSMACWVNSAASIEMGAVAVVTARPSGSTTESPRTSMPSSRSRRAHERRKLPRYSSVWKATTSAPSRPVRICSRQGSRAKMSGDGHGTCRKNPIGCSARRSLMSCGTSISW